MGKITGFIEYDRKLTPKRPVKDRIKDWNEFKTLLDDDNAVIQAARCMDCGVPFCSSGILLNNMATGCPLQNYIPEWNELVYRGLWEDAYLRLSRTSPFPEFTARVCPAPCEGSCTNGHHQESVTVNALEQIIIDKAFENGWVKPAMSVKNTGKNIAVIGAGPAGMAAAHYLNLVGHSVTVYEKEQRAGGLLTYGIPNMKLDKKIVERRVNLLKEAGIKFEFGVNVGTDIEINDIVDDNEAVLLTIGTENARDLDIEGRDLKGIYPAIDYLKEATKVLIDGKEETITAKDKNVVVIGGGDTGTDCVATAIRQGCKSVTQFEIMDKPGEKRNTELNPWPEWPKVLKTDYGQEEAIFLFGKDPRVFNVKTNKFIGDSKNQVKTLETTNVEWVSEGGKMYPKDISGSEKKWNADLVLLALGFIGPEDKLPETLKLERDGRTNIKSDYLDFSTNNEKVFVAGDARRGQSLIVWALKEGKEAAKVIDEKLMGISKI
jgi:glutamate synthase (NADPH/NADH) small chain